VNPLQEAIQLLTKEEVRAFKLFIRKVDTQSSRKDIELFDTIRKKKTEYVDEKAYESIYPGMPKNTFHRLKSRLLFDINRSLIDLHLENNDVLKLWHFLSVVEYYLSKRHYELAHWFLRKSEKLAEKLGNHEALDIVFSEYIRLSHQVVYINPEEFIQRRKDNHAELRRIRELDDILAAVSYRLKVSQTYTGSGDDLIKLLEQTIEEFAVDEATIKNPALRIKMFQAVSRILLDRRDYEAIASFVKETYQGFEKDGIFGRSNHEVKVQMLTYMANALHKCKRFTESLKYAELLGRELLEFDSLLQDKYLFFYYNVLMINYFETDIDKAIALLEEMRSSEKIMETPFYVLFIDINLTLAWNQKKNYHKAIRHVVQTYLLDAYKSAAAGMKLHFAIVEVILRHHLKEHDVLTQRLRQIGNEFKDELTDATYSREARLLEIISDINESNNPKTDEKLLAKARKFVESPVSQEERDSEMIEYDEFLREVLGI
jgi:hypothetical protein